MKMNIFFLTLLANITLSAKKDFVLITSLYNEKKQERVEEYITCLEHNLSHQNIEKIIVFYDMSTHDNQSMIYTYLKSIPHIELKHIVSRPSYKKCFDFANKQYPNKKIIVCNADIYFNETLDKLSTIDLDNLFLALTRWNVLENGNLEIYYWNNGQKAEASQDAWIFNTPIKEIQGADNIFIGLPHCDGMIACAAQKSMMQVYNPCYDIQSCHVHLSDIRNYSGSPYPHGKAIWVPWCHLIDCN